MREPRLSIRRIGEPTSTLVRLNTFLPVLACLVLPTVSSAQLLRFGGELRTRAEANSGAGFRSNDDEFVLTRIRLNVHFVPADWFQVYAQAQDARVFWSNRRPTPTSYQDTVDLRQVYLELGNPERGRVSLRAGRQEITYGDQRIVGYNGWRNTAQSFDAVRLRLRLGRDSLDIFAAAILETRSAAFNHRVPGNNFFGAYASLQSLLPDATLEPYLFWRHAGMDVKIPGLRWVGKLPQDFDYSMEVAGQTGTLDGWGGHWQLGRALPTVKGKPHLIAEYNHASRDFTPPYPSQHDRYGLADQIGWHNLNHLRAGAEWRLAPRWQAITNFHSYWLADPRGGLYMSNGTLLARSATGTAGARVGAEGDFSILFTVDKHLQAGAGAARLFPGQFLKKTTPGIGYQFGYLMLSYIY